MNQDHPSRRLSLPLLAPPMGLGRGLIRFLLCFCLLSGAAGAARGLAGAQPAAEPFRIVIDDHGAVVGWWLEQLEEEMLYPSFRRKGKGIPDVDLRGGIVFGPPVMPADPGLETERLDDGWYESRDPSGRLWPRALRVRRRVEASDIPYVARLQVILRNTASESLSLSTTEGGDLFLLAGPLLPGARGRQEVLVEGGAEELETVKAGDGKLAGVPSSGKRWIAVRHKYFCFVLEEERNRGEYLAEKVSFQRGGEGLVSEETLTGFRIGYRYEHRTLRPQEEVPLDFKVYLGPKREPPLQQAGYVRLFNNWDGFTGGIGHLMFDLLVFFHDWTGSYGIAILLLTVLVKVILHPLNIKQLRSMQKMTALQPRMQQLKEKHKDPRELQAAMTQLYAEHDVNPLGGCLPILVQIPVFIALYSCLQGAIELKNVPFLWLPDLSRPDPAFILPILFSGSIFISQKLTQQKQMDPTQASIMQVMPIMMLVIMVNVPSGVMLYLAGQSLLSIVETRHNQKVMKMEEEAKAASSSSSDEDNSGTAVAPDEGEAPAASRPEGSSTEARSPSKKKDRSRAERKAGGKKRKGKRKK